VTLHRPRVLDSTALLSLLDGHPALMQLMDDAAAGDVFLIVPTLAIGQVQLVMAPPLGMWEHVLNYRGLRSMPLAEPVAIEAARLAHPLLEELDHWGQLLGPMTIAHTAYEASVMDGVVVTSVPAAYAGFNVALHPIR
jgi:hypothetical protein